VAEQDAQEWLQAPRSEASRRSISPQIDALESKDKALSTIKFQEVILSALPQVIVPSGLIFAVVITDLNFTSFLHH
jgi:hypothetical protein